ncbi:NAD-P-binding protein [Trametes elegans]|nr:NAD-P-binding protein [Trametes elegans]
MPAITSGRVLVTGANGFIAMWVIKTLLERGFSVRGTIRSESKAGHIREHFKPYGSKLELVIVEDITQDGAFDAVVEGVDGILHVASPVNLAAEDPEDFIQPAVKGTRSLLQSALAHRDTVRRVVVTSSCAAVSTPTEVSEGARVFDERDWNEHSVRIVREQGRAAFPMNKYRASKVLGERAAWEFVAQERARSGGTLGWDVVTLTPPFVFGPVIHEAHSLESIGATAGYWYNAIVKGVVPMEGPITGGFSWVDVRDLATAEVLALITPDAGGERFIISGGHASWREFINAARRYSDRIPKSDDSCDSSEVEYPFSYNTEKGRRVLGIKYHTIEETTRDGVEDMKTKGWL